MIEVKNCDFRKQILPADYDSLSAQFDALAAAVGFSQARCEQAGDSPLDCAQQLAAQRDEGLAREAEYRQTIEDQRAMIEAEQEMKATARKQRDKVTKRLAEAEKLLNRWGNMFAGGIAASQLEDLRNDNAAFLASPGCADGEKAVCRGSKALGTACGVCERCVSTEKQP